MQKFESEWAMEQRHVNKGYRGFPYREGEDADAELLAWQQGKTGYPNPIVDIIASGKRARQLLWSWRQRPAVKSEAERIARQRKAISINRLWFRVLIWFGMLAISRYA